MNDYEILSKFLIEDIYEKVQSKELLKNIQKNLNAYDPKCKHQLLSCIREECYSMNQKKARTFLRNLSYFLDRYSLNNYVNGLFSKDEEIATNFVGAIVHVVALNGSTPDTEKIYKDVIDIFNRVEEKDKLIKLAKSVKNSKFLSEAGKRVENFKLRYL